MKMKRISLYFYMFVSLSWMALPSEAQTQKKMSLYDKFAIEAAKTPAEEWLKRGDDQYERNNIVGAVSCYGWAADQGNAEAQFKYGYALYFGEGIEQDYTAAAMWFKRAAMKDHPKAMNNLAYCYMYGKGVPIDYDKALNYLRESATKGCREAQLVMAECYEKGILVVQNEMESQKWKSMAEKDMPENSKENTQAINLTGDNTTETQKITLAETTESQETKSPATAMEVAQVTDPTSTSLIGDVVLDTNVISDNGKKQEQAIQIQETDIVSSELTNRQNDGPTVLSREDIINNRVPSTERVVRQVKPPVVKILFPIDQSRFHTDAIKLKYQLIAEGLEDQTKVYVMVDGVKQSQDRSVKAANTIDVDLPNHDCTVILYAQNENGNSEPASIRLIRERKQEELPRLFVVAIGVGDYKDPLLPPLKFTCKDAKDFSAAISKKKNLPYSEVQVKMLCDSLATREEFFESMDWLKQEATPNDVCIFFYAGHGFRDDKDRFYFMPYGSNTDQLYNCFSGADFRREADDVNSKFIVFVDACYSGALMDGSRSAASHFLEQLRRTKNGMILYASSASDTKSKENEEWKNGAFTKALVDALNGAAQNPGDEGLSTQQLEQFLYKEVRRLTDNHQTPIYINPRGIEHFEIFTYDEQEQ